MTSKYRNIRTVVDGHKFASKAEARRYGELKLLEKSKSIFNLYLQRPFYITIHGVHVCTYICDFSYTEMPSGAYVVEDVKGVRTAAYRIKAKLMRAVYGITIKEVK